MDRIIKFLAKRQEEAEHARLAEEERRKRGKQDGAFAELEGRGRAEVQNRPEVKTWSAALRELFDSTGISPGLFCLTKGVDKGSLSRYLNGKRVPKTQRLLDDLFALRDAAGTPVPKAVREQLLQLHRDALGAAHPHEYRVLKVREELAEAADQLRATRQHAQHLQEQLDGLNARLDEHHGRLALLSAENDRIRAEQDDYTAGLQTEIEELTRQLTQARRERDEARARCDELTEHLQALDPEDDDPENTGDPNHPTGKPEHAELLARIENLEKLLDKALYQRDEAFRTLNHYLSPRETGHVPSNETHS
ncbi:hypothetical protein [Actinocorallia herbida]|uniref:hypothetical protein n=1 Tax=Actinocorallia herbida TaxID=58109 RepID=UPI0011CD5EF8|nr:hypothetical protein [Actinocorallia herbida]